MSNETRSESFVASLWLEQGNNGDPTWRGHIRHVQSEEERYFEDLSALSEFLTRITGVSGIPIIKGHSSTRPNRDKDKNEGGAKAQR